MTITKISHFLLLSISAMTLWACTDDSDVPANKNSMEIQISPKVSTITDVTSGRSRALSRADVPEYSSHIITMDNFMYETPSIHMVCVNENTNNQVFKHWMNNWPENSVDDQWIFWWQPNYYSTENDPDKRKIYNWPEDENVKYSFYAVANTYKHMSERSGSYPKFNSELNDLNNGVVTYNYKGCDAYPGTDRYVVKDILYACTPNVSRPSDPDYRVPLTFKHAMACLEFEFKNENPNIQILIDNIHLECYAAGQFDIVPSSDNDPSKTTVRWHDLYNYTNLSYNTGQYIMRPIYMRGATGHSYTARFLEGEKGYLNYWKDGALVEQYCDLDPKLSGNYYHLIPPQRVSNGVVNAPRLALWVRMDNLNATVPPKDMTDIIQGLTGDAYLTANYSITQEQYRNLYDDCSSTFYGPGYVYVPLGSDGVTELEPGKKYHYKIIFKEGAGWNSINIQQSLLPIKTSVTVEDFEDGDNFYPLNN